MQPDLTHLSPRERAELEVEPILNAAPTKLYQFFHCTTPESTRTYHWGGISTLTTGNLFSTFHSGRRNLVAS